MTLRIPDFGSGGVPARRVFYLKSLMQRLLGTVVDCSPKLEKHNELNTELENTQFGIRLLCGVFGCSGKGLACCSVSVRWKALAAHHRF